MYTVTRTLPDGTMKLALIDGSIRNVGKHVATILDDNTRIGRKAATKCGMAAERDLHCEAEGYSFSIEKVMQS